MRRYSKLVDPTPVKMVQLDIRRFNSSKIPTERRNSEPLFKLEDYSIFSKDKYSSRKKETNWVQMNQFSPEKTKATNMSE